MIGRARGRKAVPDNVELRAKRGLSPSVPFINVPELRRDITRIKGLDNTRSPVRHAASVQVSGATGTAAATINGVYRPVAGEGVGGKPVYKKDGADVCIEYWPGREQWQMKPGSDTGRDSACMHSLGYQKEAGVVEEVTAGWYVYDSTTKVWSEQAGVRVVRYAAAVVYRTSSTESTRSPKASQELKSADEKQAKAKKDAHKLKRQSSQRKELSQKPTEKDIMDTRFQLHSDSGLAPASADAKLHQAHERALEEFQSFLPHESVCARATKSNKNVT
jgi:hypothetical protein